MTISFFITKCFVSIMIRMSGNLGKPRSNSSNGGFCFSTLVGTSCDFDSGLCDGWRQSNADVFDWTRNTGSTASPNTGPSFDHTSGSGR